MSEWTGIFLETSLLTIGVWFAMFGLNVPVRRWYLRRYEATHDKLEHLIVKREVEPIRRESVTKLLNRIYLLAIALGVVQFIYMQQPEYKKESELQGAVLLGIAIGVFVVGILWMIYRRSKTVNALEMLFDRKGISIYPVRRGLSGQGTYETRVDWKDCIGYWVYKDYFILSLRPIGQIEQYGGPEMARIERTLHRLGVRKLVSYDTHAANAMTPAQLSELDHRVLRMSQEVIAGYANDCAMLQMQVEGTIEWRTDDDRYSVLILRSLVDGEEVQTIEWLLWGADDQTQETLGLPDDRLYEGMDERVQSLLDTRRRDLGREAQPAVLQ
ncbi:hypothetical protein JJB07_08960 [Tumebacillus sp. ITR2]|uniref:Uncharacterized protein n=1 Tax=Tumebacillus amylolyticus TaxID=2801339 RepID=A0ABS1J930_9BACL|nr:hypothetical protein [Tumebacillus amylolyticus]MBL0386781.1 hypothetical protein [Tumebacillus amylolyticus]